MIIDHMGYAVADMEKAKQTMEVLGFRFGEQSIEAKYTA